MGGRALPRPPAHMPTARKPAASKQAASKADVVEATDSFVTEDFVSVAKGERYRTDDAIVKAHPSMFKSSSFRPGPSVVESATAAPGEQRGDE